MQFDHEVKYFISFSQERPFLWTMTIEYHFLVHPGVGVTESISFILFFCPVYHHHENTTYLLEIIFIFDRCYCSPAAVTPVKYEYDSNDLTYILAKIKTIPNWWINEWSVSNPHPGAIYLACQFSRGSRFVTIILPSWLHFLPWKAPHSISIGEVRKDNCGQLIHI